MKFSQFVLFILHVTFSYGIFYFQEAKEEPEVKPVPDLIKYHGYRCEIHKVTTEDGYILELHRIPKVKICDGNSTTSKPAQVVLLVHCLLCTSSIWVMQGPEKGLAYMLSDDNYDVWMVNMRGSTHSKTHVKLSTKSKKYWDFSWHEIAIYDIPATIDYILGSTGQKQLDYVGYSMGTTVFFALMSVKPEYNSKIRKMIALAPAAFISHSKGILVSLSTFANHFEKIAAAAHQYEFPSNSKRIRESIHQLCDYKNIFLRPSCSKFFYLLIGTSNENSELERLHIYFSYFPDTTSVRSIIHFYQVRNSGKFRQFNYGKRRNTKIYNSTFPPPYNLSQVAAPVYLFWADDDTVTTPEDTALLKSRLPNVALDFKINVPKFSHADFGWGASVKKVVYDYVMKALHN